MKITELSSVPRSSFYFDDQAAITRGRGHGRFHLRRLCDYAGFDAIRQSGEAISVSLNSRTVSGRGDCASGRVLSAGGRGPAVLRAERYIPWMRSVLGRVLIGLDVTKFADNAR